MYCVVELLEYCWEGCSDARRGSDTKDEGTALGACAGVEVRKLELMPLCCADAGSEDAGTLLPLLLGRGGSESLSDRAAAGFLSRMATRDERGKLVAFCDDG